MKNAPLKTVKDISLTNAEWQARKIAAIARGEGNLAPVYIERAENAEMWDVEGRRYIDFGTGIAVCNTGHSHSKVVAAVKDQVDRFSHTCVMVTPYDTAVRLAEELNRLAPGPSPKKSIFVTTGAEAVENAIKIARAHTRRRGVIAFNGGYHGRTNFTLGLTGKNAPYKTHFGPFPADIYRVPYPINYHGVSLDDTLHAIEMLFKCDIIPEDVAAIIVEPVQGEGGFYPASDAFLRAIRDLCDRHGIVMIADEIQSGFGRTGKFFCMEHSGIEPDLMTVAKGMAGGFPIAGVVGKAEIMDAPLPGGLGGTYAGSPVGCAAALAVIDVIEEEQLVDRANHISSIFDARLKALREQFPALIGEIRTDRGAMMAVELIQDGDPSKPNPELVKAVVGDAYQQGLVILSCGVRGNVFRFLPALTIPDALIHEGLDIFEKCLSRMIDA
ncbi:4-aminobutyrate transaminase [Algimonas ampicilliniresistens]|uniref:4-aminobutyrate transaminase n=1 Tax=Algimonas ampicilliniresistens TaxID=1298735 RepID=A0ABQ5V773_9PROT|nr:4-aminobutyrate--2-oxoglutarate transaminase [Algimonas ampicilliniresistens]GLQ22431.1 4-aminobutyrate transaminase [Algimonas ampicilliniresistens]